MASDLFDLAELRACLQAAHYSRGTAVAIGVSSLQGPDLLAARGFTPGGTAFSPHTMVYVGSLAKQITAACAALLVNAGQLHLESSIRTWLPELPAWAKTIRIRHLLHHTGDLPHEAAISDLMRRAGAQHRTSPAMLAALSTLSDHQPQPGTRYAYSNCGYVCLATIVERASGYPLPAFADQRLFAPLRMAQTCYWSGPAVAPPGAVALARSLDPAPLSLGDGGVWTTVSDLLRWNDALTMNLLGMTELLHTPGQLDDGTPLDYAWGIRVFEAQGTRLQSHGGSWTGVTAKLVRLPDRGQSIVAVALHDEIKTMIALIAAVQRQLLTG